MTGGDVPGGTKQDERLVRYLLGELSGEERDQLEAEYLGNAELHEELVAVEDELIYAYVGGRLSPSQSPSFERFFLQTPERRSRVEFAHSFAQFLEANPGLKGASHVPGNDRSEEDRSVDARERLAATPVSKTFWIGVVAWGKNPIARLAFAALIVAISLVSFLRYSRHPKFVQNKPDAVIKYGQPSTLTHFPGSDSPPAGAVGKATTKLASKMENIGTRELYFKGQSLIRSGPRDEKTLKEALALFESATKRDPSFALAYTGIADAAMHLYNINNDGALTEKALVAATRAKALNDNLPEVHSILGIVYTATGKNTEAVAELKRALELAPNAAPHRVLDEEYPIMLNTRTNLASVYLAQGNYAQAEPLLTSALEVQRRVLGEDHPITLNTMATLALLYFRQRKHGQAEPLFTKALEAQRRVLGEEHPATLRTMNNLAGIYLFEGQYKKSEVLAREALKAFDRSTSLDSWLRFNCQSLLGADLMAQKKYEEAEPLLLSAYEGMLQREASIPAGDRFLLERAGRWVVQLYEGWEKPEEAAEWRDKLKLTKSSTRAR
jgi:tetratricopeptide (TPR) repeat protein